MSTAAESSHPLFPAEAGFEPEPVFKTLASGDSRPETTTERRTGLKRNRRAAPAPNPRLLSIRDAATYMACSEWVVRSLIDTGQLPHLKLGKKRGVDRGDLGKFIDSHGTTHC
jgi:excisionase family DNA binding protein